MNYLVCNTVPDLPKDVSIWNDSGSYPDLVATVEHHVNRDDPAITSGAINAVWAVRLLDDINCEGYRAVLGPPNQSARSADNQLLQVYLIRRQDE